MRGESVPLSLEKRATHSVGTSAAQETLVDSADCKAGGL